MNLVVRSATTFSTSGELDEEAFGRYLQRFVDANVSVLLASGGSGEGNALTRDEIDRIYRIGVEVCKGRVLVGSNQPETHTARSAIEHARLAADAGVDVINIYGPAGWHGYQPRDNEYLAYFDRILAEIKHPVALGPNSILGYSPPASVLAEICHRHGQVSTVFLSGVSGDQYFCTLKDALRRDVDLYVDQEGSFNTLALGAAGLLGGGANFIPNTIRRYLDLYEINDIKGASVVYADLKRVADFARPWRLSSPRFHKMVMTVFKLPGGEGGLREPYLMASDSEIEKFTRGALDLDLREINEMAQAAGVR